MWRWFKRLWLPAVAAIAVAAALWAGFTPVAHRTLPADGESSRLYFSPDSRCLATVHYSPERRATVRIRICDIATGEHITLRHGKRQLESLAFSPDSCLVAARWFDGGVQVWDRHTGITQAEYRREEWKDWCPHLQVAFDESGSLLVHGPKPSSGQQWDVATGQQARTLFGQDTSLQIVVGTSPGFIVGFNEGQVTAWDLVTGKRCSQFHAPGQVSSGLFDISANGRFMVGIRDEHLKVWSDTEHDLGWTSIHLTNNLAMSSKGDLVAMAVVYRTPALPSVFEWLLSSRDGYPEVRVVAVPTGALQGAISKGEFSKFSPDGGWLAVVGKDSIRLFELPLSRPWKALVGWPLVAFGMTGLLMTLVRAFWNRRAMSVSA